MVIAALVLWTILMAAVVFVVVPMVISRAARLVRATRSIEAHFRRTLEAAAGIAGNTQPATPALDETGSVAVGIAETAARIDAHSAAIEALMLERAGLGASE